MNSGGDDVGAIGIFDDGKIICIGQEYYVEKLLELDIVKWKCKWCIANWLYSVQSYYNVN